MGKASEELVRRFEELGELLPGTERRQMFGCPCYLVDRRLVLGAHESGLFVKLPPEAGVQLLAEGGRRFEPNGRSMGGFYVLPEGDVSDWVRLAFDHVKALPAKQA